MSEELDTKHLREVWSAFGCAHNPDDFKPEVRESMWRVITEMATQSTERSSRVYRENQQLENEVERLRGLVGLSTFNTGPMPSQTATAVQCPNDRDPHPAHYWSHRDASHWCTGLA